MTKDKHKAYLLPQTLHATVGGMHCIACAALIENRLNQVPGVVAAQVYYTGARAVITHGSEVDPVRLNEALQAEGYTLTPIPVEDGNTAGQRRFRAFLEIGGAFTALIAVALLLQYFQVLPDSFAISDNMSYGIVFLIGLVASVSSCLAVTGGLLIALAAKYNEVNPYFTDRQRFIPHLYFNAGRVFSYTVLGGAIGALGAALTLPPAAVGTLTLVASLIMVALGLNMLGVFPAFQHLLPRLPQRLTAKLYNASSVETKSTAFLLGGATFFFPCGFTQALQLYVLTKGDLTIGALTMLAFAVGTLPALLSLSAISSLAKGTFQRHFLRFAGAGVVLLGLINIQYGVVLTGSDMNPAAILAGPATTASSVVEGTQRIRMKVSGLSYQPHQFIVMQGVPVEWSIDADQADGCGRMLVAPGLQIRKLLTDSSTLIRFTPDRLGEFAFNCGMGMMTPDAKITVRPSG